MGAQPLMLVALVAAIACLIAAIASFVFGNRWMALAAAIASLVCAGVALYARG